MILEGLLGLPREKRLACMNDGDASFTLCNYEARDKPAAKGNSSRQSFTDCQYTLRLREETSAPATGPRAMEGGCTRRVVLGTRVEPS
jgi:hypothetical protein